MTPLPPPLGPGGPTVCWRIDRRRHAESWASGEGAFQFGGRWNSRGVRAVYMSLDPSTCILEVAVHKGFAALDATPHVLTRAELVRPGEAVVVRPSDVPNPHWLRPGIPSAGQQAYGDDLLRRAGMIAVPSVVSTHSWNLVIRSDRVAELLGTGEQEAFALDPRLHPPAGGQDVASNAPKGSP